MRGSDTQAPRKLVTSVIIRNLYWYMWVFNWIVKRLLSYVCVEEKAHTSKSNFASTTKSTEMLTSLNRTTTHNVTTLTIVEGQRYRE